MKKISFVIIIICIVFMWYYFKPINKDPAAEEVQRNFTVNEITKNRCDVVNVIRCNGKRIDNVERFINGLKWYEYTEFSGEVPDSGGVVTWKFYDKNNKILFEMSDLGNHCAVQFIIDEQVYNCRTNKISK